MRPSRGANGWPARSPWPELVSPDPGEDLRCYGWDRVGHFVRETYRMGLLEARAKAREWFDEYPKAAYWTEVESWRQLEGDQIEFTMRRLPSAD